MFHIADGSERASSDSLVIVCNVYIRSNNNVFLAVLILSNVICNELYELCIASISICTIIDLNSRESCVVLVLNANL